MLLDKYNGFTGSAEIDLDSGKLHGKILFVRDLVTYSADTIPELIDAFQDAVDDYLTTCKQLNRDPDKPASGTFNVRVGEELHRDAVLAAARNGETLNEFVATALSLRLNQCREVKLQIMSESTLLTELGSQFQLSYEDVNPVTVSVARTEVGYERKH